MLRLLLKSQNDAITCLLQIVMYPVMEKEMENKRKQRHILIKRKEASAITYPPAEFPGGT